MTNSGAKKHILIVEDDEAIATGLSLNLKLEGFSSEIVEDGESVENALTNNPVLVLLDINMPKKDGLEVLKDLRESGNKTPVIVLSAREGEYDKVAALRLGADDYVTKPFALAELIARIDAVLRRAEPDAVDSIAAKRLRRYRGGPKNSNGKTERHPGENDPPRV